MIERGEVERNTLPDVIAAVTLDRQFEPVQLDAAHPDRCNPGTSRDHRRVRVTATKWRAKAKGPPFIKLGRLVRYRRSDVDPWLRANTTGALAS